MLPAAPDVRFHVPVSALTRARCLSARRADYSRPWVAVRSPSGASYNRPTTHPILGLHHMLPRPWLTHRPTSTSASIGRACGWSTKMVNFDNHDAHRLHDGTEHGAPGTILVCTFPYAHLGVRVGTKGAGQVVTTSFSVPVSSLPFWRRRLNDRGVATHDIDNGLGEETIRVSDCGCSSNSSGPIATRARRGRAAASAQAKRSVACTV